VSGGLGRANPQADARGNLGAAAGAHGASSAGAPMSGRLGRADPPGDAEGELGGFGVSGGGEVKSAPVALIPGCGGRVV